MGHRNVHLEWLRDLQRMKLDELTLQLRREFNRTQPITASLSVRIYCNLRGKSCPDLAWIPSCNVWYSVIRLESDFRKDGSDKPPELSPPTFIYIIVWFFVDGCRDLNVGPRFIDKMTKAGDAQIRHAVLRPTIVNGLFYTRQRAIIFEPLERVAPSKVLSCRHRKDVPQ